MLKQVQHDGASLMTCRLAMAYGDFETGNKEGNPGRDWLPSGMNGWRGYKPRIQQSPVKNRHSRLRAVYCFCRFICLFIFLYFLSSDQPVFYFFSLIKKGARIKDDPGPTVFA
ncbi:hypothetical protein [Gaoshiqia sp. Z1-71]|uniref:hypothetical protein n=1 Tax=Gaoshiqia hydrogeniformans TaxID=3290090 RepID=UPI003BF7AF29